MKKLKSVIPSEMLGRDVRESRGHCAWVTVCLAALMVAALGTPASGQPTQAPSSGVDSSLTPVPIVTTDLGSSTPIATAKVLYVKEKAGDSRIWESVATAPNSLGQINSKTNQIQELATGMHYLDGSEWKTSDASFTETKDEFVADKIQHRSRIKRDLNV